MIQSYFESEKRAGFWALSIGLTACSISSAVFISAQPPFYTGLGLAFMVIGVIQIVVGGTLARRSDYQMDDLEKLRAASPQEFIQLEAPRMEKILRNFKRFKWLEIAVLILGLALIVLNKEPLFSKGLGTGLVFQSVIMLLFDFFAEKRAQKYTHYITHNP